MARQRRAGRVRHGKREPVRAHPPRLSFVPSRLHPAASRLARGKPSRRPGARRLPPVATVASSSRPQPAPHVSRREAHAESRLSNAASGCPCCQRAARVGLVQSPTASVARAPAAAHAPGALRGRLGESRRMFYTFEALVRAALFSGLWGWSPLASRCGGAME